MTFEISKDHIELNKLLKIINWVESGGEAGLVIAEGLVVVNGEVDTRKRKKCRKGDVIEFEDQKVTII